MARVCSCKRSDRSKCGEAQARVAKQARSDAEAPKVIRRLAREH
ncbi:TraY domain-containing protein [Leptospira sp. B5-022]|nr:TraY domain-containing protein [Leptospira sp. id769339]